MQRGEQQPPGNRLQLLQVVVGGCCWQFLTFQVKVVSRISALSCVKDALFPEKFKQVENSSVLASTYQKSIWQAVILLVGLFAV